ncbi:MAG: PTS system mannose/fructose/sorbose family transporter subunit IID [Elusimicrobiales bacterium]|nr:PTS system mannose/fructose/sorbose family transporter subunit IID [Elusimicrobiales bacterium]
MERKLRGEIFRRSFMVQACWNFEKLQNVGFAWAIYPALRVLYKGRELGESVRRHLEIFNTQPFMASFALGVTVKMEEERAALEPARAQAAAERISEIKAALAPPLAAIGDKLFWSTLRPFTLVVSLLVWWLLGLRQWSLPLEVIKQNESHFRFDMPRMLVGLLAGLAVYNAMAIWIRWKGLKYGYKCGAHGACGIDFMDWQGFIGRLRACGFGAALLLLALKAYGPLSLGFRLGADRRETVVLALLPLVMALTFFTARLGMRNSSLYFGALALCAASLFFI